jgi:hypothetical protein
VAGNKIFTDSSPVFSDFPSAHHPESHIVKRFKDYFAETAPEMLLGKTDDLSAAHHNGTEIPAKSGFDNFMNSIAFNGDEVAGYPIGVDSRIHRRWVASSMYGLNLFSRYL